MNGVQFAARQLKGETAKWSGDFTDKKRVFGAIHPERGIDWQYFESTAKKEGLKLAAGTDLVYTRADRHQPDRGQEPGGGPDPRRQAQGRGRHHGDAVRVVHHEPGSCFKAADSLDYHPEWLFPGYGVSDIEITARINNERAPSR